LRAKNWAAAVTPARAAGSVIVLNTKRNRPDVMASCSTAGAKPVRSPTIFTASGTLPMMPSTHCLNTPFSRAAMAGSLASSSDRTATPKYGRSAPVFSR